MPDDVHVRVADLADLPALLGVLDAAALETDHDRARTSVEGGRALVAVADRAGRTTDTEGSTATDGAAARTGTDTEGSTGTDGDGTTGTDGAVARTGTVVGALVREGDEIAAVAVRRGRRGQGVGTALVDRAAAHARREGQEVLVAEFDGDMNPFYETLGFDIERAPGEDRYRGSRPL